MGRSSFCDWVGMMINTDCQLNWIRHYLKHKHLDTSVRVFPRRIKWGKSPFTRVGKTFSQWPSQQEFWGESTALYLPIVWSFLVNVSVCFILCFHKNPFSLVFINWRSKARQKTLQSEILEPPSFWSYRVTKFSDSWVWRHHCVTI